MATRAEWSERVSRWKRSGLGAAEFAQQQGLSVQQLYWWSCKLRKQAQPSACSEPSPAVDEQPRFLPVHVLSPLPQSLSAQSTERAETSAASQSSVSVEVALPNGCLVRVLPGCDLTMLAQVLAIAAEVATC